MKKDIQHELRGAIIESDDLLEHLTDNSVKNEDAVRLAMELIKGGELLPPRGYSVETALGDRRVTGWKWTNLPESIGESVAVEFLNRISASICGDAALRVFANPNGKATYPLLYGFDRKLEDLRPDFVLLPKDGWIQSPEVQLEISTHKSAQSTEPNQAYNNYQNCLVVCECKFSDTAAARWQLLKYVRGLKRSQLWRRFAVGIYITGSVCGVVRADQSGVEDIPFALQTTDGVIKLIRLLFWLSVGEVESFGFDPSFGLQRSRISLPLRGNEGSLEYVGWDIARITCGNAAYSLDKLIYNGVSIRGRGTRVFRVYEANDEAKANPFALKILWEDIGRERPEAFFHDRAISRNVQHVLLADERHRYAYDTTLHGIRGYDNGAAKAYSSTFEIESRREARILLPYHAPLREFSNIDGLVRGLIGAIKGHQSLYEASILHRDVSERNILLGKDDRIDDGFLIDLDMACLHGNAVDPIPSTPSPETHRDQISSKKRGGPLLDGTPPRKRHKRPLDSSEEEDTEVLDELHVDSTEELGGHKGHRTGTIPYMACGVLCENEPHELKHDLESFFYVLFMIPFTYDSPLPGRQRINWVPSISRWCRGDMQTCGVMKRGLMMKRQTVLETLTNDTPEGWRENQDTFLEFLGIVWRVYSVLRPVVWSDDDNESKPLTHEDLLQPMMAWLAESSTTRKISIETLQRYAPNYHRSLVRSGILK